jgi:hypothetical protein
MSERQKRSFISKSRLDELKQLNAVYVISCVDNEYYCEDHKDGKCSRGFFSFFIQVVYGISFAKKLDLPFYVDFGNVSYQYSNKISKNGDKNFWNYFFVQNPIESFKNKVLNSRYETFPLRIWNRNFFHEMHKSGVGNLELRSEIKDKVLKIKNEFALEKILGVHVRRTDHRLEIVPAEDKLYFKFIDKFIKRFDKLFLATDDYGVIEMYKKKYGAKLIYHDFIRSINPDVPIHNNPENTNGYEIGMQALLECYSLSFCDKVILSPSNLSYSALLLNPSLEYTLAESFDAKRKRLKTVAVYLLNKWRIRRW